MLAIAAGLQHKKKDSAKISGATITHTTIVTVALPTLGVEKLLCIPSLSRLQTTMADLDAISVVEMLISRGNWTYAQLLDMVSETPDLLCFLLKQTPEMCLAAVKKSGMALRHVEEQTYALCLTAVTECGEALAFVAERFHTPELERAAVEQSPFALPWVLNQTTELCLMAVSKFGDFLSHVKEQNPAICLAAVTNRGSALEHVKERTNEICLAAVTNDGMALRHVKNQTKEIVWAAIANTPAAMDYVTPALRTGDFLLALLGKYPEVLTYIRHRPSAK